MAPILLGGGGEGGGCGYYTWRPLQMNFREGVNLRMVLSKMIDLWYNFVLEIR